VGLQNGQGVDNESHNVTSVPTNKHRNLIGYSVLLVLAQGLTLTTPDPFS